jgi:hypothetical protein
MSREYREPSWVSRLARRIVAETWSITSSVLVITAGGLLVTHLIRKMDKGLVHWPLHPERTIRLGG